MTGGGMRGDGVKSCSECVYEDVKDVSMACMSCLSAPMRTKFIAKTDSSSPEECEEPMVKMEARKQEQPIEVQNDGDGMSENEEWRSALNAIADDEKSGVDTTKPSCYRKSFSGLKLDPYRVMAVYGITHPAHQHATKKLLRAGNGHKPLRKDILETIDALNRWLEMLEEDAQP